MTCILLTELAVMQTQNNSEDIGICSVPLLPSLFGSQECLLECIFSIPQSNSRSFSAYNCYVISSNLWWFFILFLAFMFLDTFDKDWPVIHLFINPTLAWNLPSPCRGFPRPRIPRLGHQAQVLLFPWGYLVACLSTRIHLKFSRDQTEAILCFCLCCYCCQEWYTTKKRCSCVSMKLHKGDSLSYCIMPGVHDVGMYYYRQR